jgi:LPXTG-site transpeptidase (sortase) family protein
VQEIGTYRVEGQVYWETVPFVVGHYKTTAKAGETGNAVFSGHVTSRNAGNVLKDLYRMKVGDEIKIYTEESEFTYEVIRVRLVPPTEVGVMDPTSDASVTLITCAGEWIPEKREFSQRLIILAKLCCHALRLLCISVARTDFILPGFQHRQHRAIEKNPEEHIQQQETRHLGVDERRMDPHRR